MLSLLHMLMLFLLFMQLIPSLSLLLPATWPIRPFLYRSFPSAVDILCLNSAASPLRWCEKSLLGHTVSNLLCLGRLIRAVRWGPLWSVFNQVRFFSVRLQSNTLSFKDIRLWQSGKCPSVTPSWEIFYFVFYDAEKTTYVLFFLFLMGHKILHQVRSLSFVFPLIQGILIMLLQYEFLKKKKTQECCSSILEKPLHCFFWWQWAHLQLYCCLLLCSCQKMETLIYSQQISLLKKSTFKCVLKLKDSVIVHVNTATV